MKLADLAFIAAFLTTVFVAIRAGWHFARGRRIVAQRIVVRWGIGAAIYLAALVMVSLLQAGRVVLLGEDECFDDWCVAVTGATRTSASRLVVDVRIRNRGLGRPQAEPDAYVFLVDDRGRAAQQEMPDVAQPSIGRTITAGDSLLVHVPFDVPPEFAARGLVKARHSRFPATIIIGDAASWLHQPTVHVLEAPPLR